jgi:hypothetical protein
MSIGSTAPHSTAKRLALNYGTSAARCFFDIAQQRRDGVNGVQKSGGKKNGAARFFSNIDATSNTLHLRVALARVAYAQYANIPPASRTAVHPAKEREEDA